MALHKRRRLWEIIQGQWFPVSIGLLVLFRLAHVTGPIRGSAIFRQCDTANYSWNFYLYGLNIFKPMVSWMGGYGVQIFEFPLPEFLAALFYRAFGPSIIFDRLICLAFFLGSAYFLFRITAYLWTPRLARGTVLFYMLLPLGLFYSTAVHVDFSAVFFAHGMFYYLLRGYDEDRNTFLLAGWALGLLAFLIKVPYAFYFFVPLGYHVVVHFRPRGAARLVAVAMGLGLLFWVWRLYVERTNAAAPDWYFIPGYSKMVDMNWWYFGAMTYRLNPENWHRVFTCFMKEVTTPLGLLLLVVGAFLKSGKGHAGRLLRAWMVGALIYLFIFFNLVRHNYYQIPFLAVVSVYMARSLEGLMEKGIPRSRPSSHLAVAGLLLLFAVNSYAMYARRYNKLDTISSEIGRRIEEATPRDSLVVIAREGLANQDPIYFCRSRRRGWPMDRAGVSQAVLDGLIREGAGYLVWIEEAGRQAPPPDILRSYPYREWPVRGEETREGKLRLYRLVKGT